MSDLYSDDLLANVLADFLALDGDAIKAAAPSVPVRVAPPVVSNEPARPLSLREEIAPIYDADPSRLPWPDDWFAYTDTGQAAVCRRLWAEVMLNCIRGALELDRGLIKSQSLAHVSPEWFRSHDFAIICDMLGLNPVAFRDALTDPARLPQIIARLQGATKGAASQQAKQRARGDLDG